MSSHMERNQAQLERMREDARRVEERAKRAQELTDPRQVKQCLGVIAARTMQYM